MELKIRKASVGDANLIAIFGVKTFRAAFGPFNSPEDMESYLALNFHETHIRELLDDPRSVFLLAYLGDHLMGYSMLSSGDYPASVTGRNPIELVRIYIDNLHTGKGYGSTLLEACMANAMGLGHDVIWLGVWEKNEGAISFYERWGFTQAGWKEFILGSDVQRDLVMERIIY